MTKAWLLVGLMLSLAFAGCVDDAGDGDGNGDGGDGADPDYTEMVDDSHVNGGPRGFLPDPVTGMEYVTTAVEGNARGIWVNDDLAYVSGTPGLRIVDVSDPAEPVILAQDVLDTDGGGSRDIDFLDHPNGRHYAVMSRGGVVLVDVTDPTDPFVVSEAEVASHNMAVVPGTTIVYNSRSISTHTPTPGTTGQVDIVDFADPENPEVTVFAFPAVIQTPMGIPKAVGATTCHDITFSITEDHQWAYCAGVTETHIWDINDPAAPEIIQVIDWPGNQIHHGAWGARDGDILIIGDEFAGAAAGVCTVAQDPYAALWFFDVSDIETPIPLGYHRVDYTSIDAPTELCTTHFGTLVEDRDMFVLGWYTGGVTLIDFSDPAAPVEVDSYRPDGAFSVWDARYYKGHVYTGDSARGVDVLRII